MKITGTQNKRKNQYSFLLQEKGIGFFRLLYDEWCDESTVDLRIFNQFTIYSDRYLTKVIEPEILKAKKC